jgi:glycerol-3-phosphate dehydrogenase (NAD(P)+)
MKNTVPYKIAVLGAGSWGTAVAMALAHQGHSVLLWARSIEHIAHGQNEKYLPGIPFPKTLDVSNDLNKALTAEYVLIAVPSHAFLALFDKIPKLPQTGIAWLTKGVEPQSNRLFSDIIEEKYGKTPMAIISGPSFAKEVALQKPTGLIVAGNNNDFQNHWQKLLHSEYNRVYLSDDLLGVQLCGAVKNVLAIACGISDGLTYGANARAALITRGIAEMTQLGRKMGAKDSTFSGLAGLGDLVLTCTDNQSRNRRFGLYLGKGMSLLAAEKEVKQVVEGLHNAKQVVSLAKTYQIEMPICEAVHSVLNGSHTPQEAAKALLQRPMPKID